MKSANKDPQAVGDIRNVSDTDSSDTSVSADASLSIETTARSTTNEDVLLTRNATWLDILYHSVTAMVGAGVLGLPAAFAHLGWAGGIIFLAFSFWVSWYSYKLLVCMHEVPDLGSKTGGIRRLDRYDQLAEYVWGKGRGKKILLPFQLAVLLGMSITYTVVGGENLMAFAKSITPPGGANLGKFAYILMFGGIEFFLSMMPSLHEARLCSLLGALMSVAYCTIAVVMSATVNPASHNVSYDPATVERSTTARVMGIFNAMTTVFFAYGGHNVALELQAHIRITDKQPTTVPTMMKGVNWTFVITGLCYFGVSILGFWAFGTGVADNVLMAFEHGPTHWVVAMANMFVVVHVAAAFQVYTQPVFTIVEARLRQHRRDDDLPIFLQFGLRVVYVCGTTIIALLIPFFGSLMGLVGAIAITPTTFMLPSLLWLMYKSPPKWSANWTVNWTLVYLTGLLGVLGCIGSLYSIIVQWSSFKIFAN